MDDSELLDRYGRDGDQEAFAQLVGRHSEWIYPSARRQLGDAHLAEDVTQAVFLLLARKAAGISARANLGGWLFGTLRYCVKEAGRQRFREQKRVKEAAQMKQDSAAEANWELIAPLLDEAIGRLRKSDREAVLLRFYQRKPLAEVGRMLGVSEDAARMRVDRAVEKLRGMLEREGVMGTSAGLSAVLVGNVVEQVPARVVEGVMSAVGGGASTVAGGIAKGAMKMMVLAKVKVMAGAAVVVVALIGAAWAAGEAGNKASLAAGQSAVTVPVGKDVQITVEARYLVFEGADLRAVKSLVSRNGDLDPWAVSELLAQDPGPAIMTAPRMTVDDGERASVTAPFGVSGVPGDAPMVGGKPVRASCEMAARMGADKSNVDITMRLDLMVVIEAGNPAVAGSSKWKRVSLDIKTSIPNGLARVAGMQTEAIGGGRERLSFALIRPVIITRRADASGVSKRLRFAPSAVRHGVSQEAASLPRLTLDAATGTYKAVAFVPVGERFWVRSHDDEKLFVAKVLEGDDSRLVVEVSQGNDVKRIELQRDKTQRLEANGGWYEMTFASEYSAPAGPDTTTTAMIEVTTRP